MVWKVDNSLCSKEKDISYLVPSVVVEVGVQHRKSGVRKFTTIVCAMQSYGDSIHTFQPKNGLESATKISS